MLGGERYLEGKRLIDGKSVNVVNEKRKRKRDERGSR
jgi:hypothetical protein